MNILENLDKDKLAKWFEARSGRPFLYTSVDIRDSGFKIAPVDTNLFPAGFNNLNNDALKNASEAAQTYLQKYYPKAKKIAILAENFSRNTYYWQNIAALKGVITNAGYEVIVAVDDNSMPDVVENIELVKLEKVQADLIIANKDFTGSPIPNIQIPIIPSPQMGWHTRRKSQHFESYDIVAKEFAKDFGFDPWLISTLHQKCRRIDFKKGEGFECLAENANNLLSEVRRKYQEYKIESDPYIYIKADSGTFGMGIMTIKSILEIKDMNKKLRNKMDRIKEGVHNTEVLLQEGVPTINQLDGKPAEPFLYCIGGKPIGAILRVNENKDAFGNLNSAGMTFEPIECAQIAEPCEFSPAGIIARLASLAVIDEAQKMNVAA